MHSSAKSMSGFFLFTIYCIENQYFFKKKKRSNHLTDLEKTNVKFRISLAFLASIKIFFQPSDFYS